MGAYILRRLLLIIPTLIGIMVINFSLTQLVPGGPIEQVAARLRELGIPFVLASGGHVDPPPSEFAAVPMIAAGAPLWVILAAAFCVNLRFVVFSAHLRPYLMHLPRWQRMVTGYVTGDLSYVFFARRFPHPGQNADELARQQAYLMGNCAVNYLAWMVASVTGVALANAIPTAWGLGFAGILALLGVLSSLASSPLRIVSAGVAGAAAVAAWALPLKLNILVAIASAVAICLVLEKAMPHRPAAGAPHV